MPKLTMLQLRDNYIVAIDGAGLINLSVLALDENSITHTGDLTHLPPLNELSLDYQRDGR